MHDGRKAPMKARGQRGRRLAAILAGCALVLGMPLLAGQVCPGSPGAQPADPAMALRADLVHLHRTTREALEALPFEEFQVQARQAALGDDPQTLFAWVRDETRWLPYAGALRGARGVLMDRTGSSLDRALALAALLEAAGHTARLARAPLELEDLDRLAQIWAERLIPVPPRPAVDAGALDEAIGETAARTALEAETLRRVYGEESDLARQARTRLREQTRLQQESLARHLQPAAASSAPETPADHWWVQLRTASGWQDLDPALPDHRPGQRLVPGAAQATHYADELPAQYRHRLTITVIALQWDGRRFREHVALEHTVPAALLATEQVRIETFPVNLPSLDAMLGNDPGFDQQTLPDAVLEETEWMPLLRIGDEVITDKSVLSDGTVQEQIGQTPQGAALSEATGLLGGIGVRRGRGAEQEEAPPPELAAVLVRLTVEAPDRPAETFERPLVDVAGPAVRSAVPDGFGFTDAMRRQRAAGLLGTLELAGQVAWIPWGLTTGLGYEALMEQRLAALGAVHSAWSDSLEFMGSALEESGLRRSELDRLAFLRRSASPHEAHIALTRLNLLGFVRLVDLDDDGGPRLREGFDLIDNRVDVVAAEGNAREIRLAQGVLDTLLEAELKAGERPLDNTARVFLEDLAAGREWRHIAEVSGLEALDWRPPPDIAAHLESVLADGRQVVLPERLAQGAGAVWWELDPASGGILGMGPDRRGQGVEAILILMNSINNAASAVGMVQTIWACMFNSAGPAQARCCIRNAAVMAAVSSYMSNGLSSYAELSGLVITGGNRLFDMLNRMAIGQMAGQTTSAFLGATAPEGSC
ncbi:hypothetical protein [Thioalkalivibrio denitrificans]|uniref:hypothetical protein n=1 Tax=Thioalkalivibrio denitrificans TaxID=108003 RepID=UPI001115762C|nr:hypothetical protein [Thioalkalivibrio denitrificans]